jgi:hypothetical protein
MKIRFLRHPGLAPQGHFLTEHSGSPLDIRVFLKLKGILDRVQNDVLL